MTLPVADQTIPPSIAELDRERLLGMDPVEAVGRLAHALGELYLLSSASDYDDDDEDDAALDLDAPLFLESLVAARLNAGLEAWLGVTVPLPALLREAPSIAGLARRLVDALHAGTVTPSLPALVPDPASRHEEFPLAEIQQAYWIGSDPVYELGNVSAFLFVELAVPCLDVPRAEWALNRLVERHDMLRSVVTPDGRQRVLGSVPPLQIVIDDDLDGVRERLLAGRMAADDWRPVEVYLAAGRLLIKFNMVKLDAWSAQLLIAEWFALIADPGSDAPEPGMTFRDYVRWTAEVEGSEAYQLSRKYWLDRVPELPPAPELPLVRALDSVEAPRFTARSVRLDAGTWSALKARAGRDGLTPSIVLCAGYAEVLAAWSRRQRFTLSLAGGRPMVHPEIGSVVGPFARPLLLEVDATSRDGFAARARAIARQFAADFEHREFGGLAVLRELARARGVTRATMPVIFTSVLPQGGEGGLRGAAWSGLDGHVLWGMPQLLLENQVLELDRSLVVTWVSVDGVFPDGLVEEMLDAYERLLLRLASSEEAWSSVSPVELPEPQVQRRAAANATSVAVPGGLLHERFGAQVAARGDAPAVIDARRTLSYRELDAASWGVAAALSRDGGGLVAVCMEKGWEQVAAVLGVLRAGAAYLPLDPELPTRRLHELLADGEVRTVLTQPWLDVALPDGVERVAVTGDLTGSPFAVTGDVAGSPLAGTGGLAGSPLAGTGGVTGSPFAGTAEPADLAYVIYTSGSTGRPKGVMIDHRGALNTVLDVNARFGIGPSDRVLALSSLSFDLSVYDIFGPLSAGGAIVLPDSATLRDPAHWARLIRDEGVTVWNSVPALMQLLAEHPSAGGGGLRLALLSGDWIPVALPPLVAQRFPGCEVISLGGATEASIWSIAFPAAQTPPGARSVPYGRPLANQRFHVLDDRMRPRPELVPGELYIGGVGLAKGYWRDPDRTAASFPVHPDTGERLYRTGDVGRYLRDGTIEFLGREDAQVKVNGFRVELGEIEAVLASHPDVRAAVAVAHGGRAEPKSLSAYVVGPVTVADLREHLAQRLPAYAVPARIVTLEDLPLTTNGKVDRSALLSAPAPADAARAAVSPATDLERRLSVLWAGVLGLAEVGAGDNFFELGGTSLAAIRLATRAQDAGLPLVAADVLRHQTVRELAAGIAGRTEASCPAGEAR